MRKALLVVMVALEVFLLFLLFESLFGFTCLYRHDFNRAFAAWHRNPTPETEKEFKRQKRINDSIKLSLDAAITALALANAFSIRHVWRGRQQRPKAP